MKAYMDSQWIINTIMGILLAGGGWFVNTLWGSIRTLQAQIVDLSVELAKEYVPRAELQRTFDNLDKKLDDIQKMLREGR
jgi:hypothetical protein